MRWGTLRTLLQYVRLQRLPPFYFDYIDYYPPFYSPFYNDYSYTDYNDFVDEYEDAVDDYLDDIEDSSWGYYSYN